MLSIRFAASNLAAETTGLQADFASLTWLWPKNIVTTSGWMSLPLTQRSEFELATLM
jgi:hypothetical protein